MQFYEVFYSTSSLSVSAPSRISASRSGYCVSETCAVVRMWIDHVFMLVYTHHWELGSLRRIEAPPPPPLCTRSRMKKRKILGTFESRGHCVANGSCVYVCLCEWVNEWLFLYLFAKYNYSVSVHLHTAIQRRWHRIDVYGRRTSNICKQSGCGITQRNGRIYPYVLCVRVCVEHRQTHECVVCCSEFSTVNFINIQSNLEFSHWFLIISSSAIFASPTHTAYTTIRTLPFVRRLNLFSK